jgi:hypothetical protein
VRRSIAGSKSSGSFACASPLSTPVIGRYSLLNSRFDFDLMPSAALSDVTLVVPAVSVKSRPSSQGNAFQHPRPSVRPVCMSKWRRIQRLSNEPPTRQITVHQAREAVVVATHE